MKNLRAFKKEYYDTSDMGFEIVSQRDHFDFSVRVLGAARGKLALLDNPETTTIEIRATSDKQKVRSLLEAVVLEDEDFFYSVSVPYVDTADFVRRVRKTWEQIKTSE